MSPNERWDDFALDRQFETINNILAATAALPTEMVKLAGAVDTASRRLDSHHGWIESVEARTEKRLTEVKELCERIGEELRNDSRERIRNRYSLMIAIIGAAAIVAAAIITSPH